MDDLIAGYRRFRASTWQTERSRFEALSRLGQRPRALIIACSDSRTDPQMVFNAVPGELFVIRNVANLAPPYGPDDQPHGVSSAIEFAVRTLKVSDIVVMGHAMCGGIKALLEGTPAELSDFVGQWVRIAEPARQRAIAASRVAVPDATKSFRSAEVRLHRVPQLPRSCFIRVFLNTADADASTDTTKWIYPDRAVGRDRDHRGLDRAVAAGRPGGA